MTGLVFVVPGRLDQLTGGYLYDRHVIDGLRSRGRDVEIIELGFEADGRTLASVADGTPTVVDALAFAGLEQAIADQERRLKLLALVHHPLAEETGLSRRDAERLAALEAALLPRFRGVLCPSRRTAAAVERYGVSPERIAVIPPGTAKPAAYRQQLRRPAGALLCVASLIPRKGHRVLVEALRRLHTLDWSLLCVGALDRDPPTTRTVRRMISAAGLNRRITLAGEWSPERMTHAYRAADIFVLPSFHEGYGMAYAEAMAHGLPIIATTAGAIPETVPRTAGLLVPPGNVAALARALRQVLVDRALAARLAAGSRIAGAHLRGWPCATEQWERAVDRLVNSEPQP
jgi:glycosyltransferase involved in cell wall biosynthesis